MPSTLLSTLKDVFSAQFGADKTPQIALAPGRVNLIGEHTDYNGGFVFPMAIDRFTGIAFDPNSSATVRVFAHDFQEKASFSLHAPLPKDAPSWLQYIWGMTKVLDLQTGFDGVLHSTVPIAAGLSSSAALEMAVGRAICALQNREWDAVLMAKLGQKAENQFVGVNCGIMDQYASACCTKDHALLLDCRSLKTLHVPIPTDAVVVIMDSGVRRSLAQSAYNDRRASCEAAVARIAQDVPEVTSLRDVTPAMLREYHGILEGVTFRRIKHVIYENMRPVQMAAALESDHLAVAGALMYESHLSLKLLYQVSCAELDLLVELAQKHEACYGARLTGAGFGGCAVALVKTDQAEAFMDEVHAAYKKSFDLPSAFYHCRPSDGARLV